MQARNGVLPKCNVVDDILEKIANSAIQAIRTAGITDPSKCFFIDDSRGNVEAAWRLGWGRCVHFCEQGMEVVEGGKPKEISISPELPGEIKVVTHLEELRTVWADVFKQA